MDKVVNDMEECLNRRMDDIEAAAAIDDWLTVIGLCGDTEEKLTQGYNGLIKYMFEAVVSLDGKKLTNEFIKTLYKVKEKNSATPYIVEQAMYFLGILHQGNKDFDKAEQEFRELLTLLKKLKKGTLNIVYMLASVHLNSDKPDLAEKNMQLVMKGYNNRSIPSPYCGFMGDVKGKLNKIKEAQYWYDRAIKSDPYETDWYKKCGLMFEKHCEYKKALKYWDKMLAIPVDKMNETLCEQDRVVCKEKRFRENVSLAKRHKESCVKKQRYPCQKIAGMTGFVKK